MMLRIFLLLLPLASGQKLEGIYCDSVETLRWDRIGLSEAASDPWECGERCDETSLCTAIAYNGTTKQCALLKEQQPVNGNIYTCSAPITVQKKLSKDFAPECSNIAESHVYNGACYFSLPPTARPSGKLTEEQRKFLPNRCACASGRRKAHLAHFPDTSVYHNLRSGGLIRAGESYLAGGYKTANYAMTPCDWAASSRHCHNWYWFDWRGRIAAPISRDVWAGGQPSNGDGIEDTAGVSDVFAGLNDFVASTDAHSILCQFAMP